MRLFDSHFSLFFQKIPFISDWNFEAHDYSFRINLSGNWGLAGRNQSLRERRKNVHDQQQVSLFGCCDKKP
jgi:hypothetical protein